MSIIEKIYSLKGYIKSLELTSQISPQQIEMLKVLLNEFLQDVELYDTLLKEKLRTDDIANSYSFSLKEKQLGTALLKSAFAENPYDQIDKRPIKVRSGKRTLWIKTNGHRVNLESNYHHSSLESGLTYYFSENGQFAKQVQNVV